MTDFVDRLRHGLRLAPVDTATPTMRRLNHKARCFSENGRLVFIEDVTDSDWRLFRLEYQTDLDGEGTRAFVHYNPWNPDSPRTPDDLPATDTHFYQGEICIGERSHGQGGYPLEYCVLRARHWVECYSFLREHGVQALREIEDQW